MRLSIQQPLFTGLRIASSIRQAEPSLLGRQRCGADEAGAAVLPSRRPTGSSQSEGHGEVGHGEPGADGAAAGGCDERFSSRAWPRTTTCCRRRCGWRMHDRHRARGKHQRDCAGPAGPAHRRPAGRLLSTSPTVRGPSRRCAGCRCRRRAGGRCVEGACGTTRDPAPARGWAHRRRRWTLPGRGSSRMCFSRATTHWRIPTRGSFPRRTSSRDLVGGDHGVLRRWPLSPGASPGGTGAKPCGPGPGIRAEAVDAVSGEVVRAAITLNAALQAYASLQDGNRPGRRERLATAGALPPGRRPVLGEPGRADAARAARLREQAASVRLPDRARRLDRAVGE